jgi:hypothetical protein
MAKPRTHFEQVPLEIVKKIVVEGIPPEAAAERHRGVGKKKVEKDIRAAHKQSNVNARRSSRGEICGS